MLNLHIAKRFQGIGKMNCVEWIYWKVGEHMMHSLKGFSIRLNKRASYQTGGVHSQC